MLRMMEANTAAPFTQIDHPLVRCCWCIVVLSFGSTYKVKLHFKWHLSDCITFLSSEKQRQTFGWTQCYWSLIVCQTSQKDQNERWHWHKPFFSSLPTILFLTNPFIFLLFLYIWTLILVVVDSSSFKIEEFFHKMAICLKNCRVEQKNHSSLARWPDWALSSHPLLRLGVDLSVHLFLDCAVPRRPLIGLRPPSTSFILSLHLTMPAVSLS